MMKSEGKNTLSVAERLLILAVFLIGLIGAGILPVDQCPDEWARRLLLDWIFENGKLPTGNEMETIIMPWGFSYALRPYLSAMISAVFMWLAALFTNDPQVLLVASRMGSILSLTACCFFCLKLGCRLFARKRHAMALAVFVCFIPQVTFLGMYQNNDILALAAVCAMLYYLAEGYDTCWAVRSCVGLAISFSVGLLSYYSVYGWFLAGGVFCVAAVLRDTRIENKAGFLLKRIALVAGICLVLAGWFFVRNAVLHDGDLLGIASEESSRRRLAALGYELHQYQSMAGSGYSVPAFLLYRNGEFFRLTAKSFFGVFGNMAFLMWGWLYKGYYAIAVLSIGLYAARLVRNRPPLRERLLLLSMLLASLISGILHFWASYTRDYQPQGRYVIAASLLLGFLLVSGLEHAELRLKTNKTREIRRAAWLSVAFGVLWVCMFVLACLTGMTQMLQ